MTGFSIGSNSGPHSRLISSNTIGADSRIRVLPQRSPLPASQGGFLLVAVAMVLTVIAVLGLISNRESIVGTKRVSGETETMQLGYVAEAGMEHALWVADQGTCSGYDLPRTPFGANSYSASFSPTRGSPVTITATGTLYNGATRRLTATGTTIYELPIDTTIQDAARFRDVYIDANLLKFNFGAHPRLEVLGGIKARHSLLRFDIDDLPQRAKLISAVLELNSISGVDKGAISVHRVTNGWLEGTQVATTGAGASWVDRDGGEPWLTPGGDYDPQAIATSLPETTDRWRRWDITSIVQAWIDRTAINNGVILVPAEDMVSASFHSSDSDKSDWHPRLILSFACECGIGGATGSAELQPGAEGLDTFLHSNKPNVSFGSRNLIRVRGSKRHGLLQFDLSGLPANVTVTRAEFRLYPEVLGDDSDFVSVHRVTQSWVEGSNSDPDPSTDGATWQSIDSVTPWVSAGGDYDPVPSDSTFVSDDETWYSWDLTSLVDSWVSGAETNNGLLVRSNGNFALADFTSSDSSDAGRRPKLIVEYSCPCGKECFASGSGSTFCDADFTANARTFKLDWMPGTNKIAGIDFISENTVINGVTIPPGGGWIMTDRGEDQFFVTDELGVTLTTFDTGIPDARGIAYIETGKWAGHLAVADKNDQAIYFIDLDGVIQGSFLTAGITTEPYGLSFIDETESAVYNGHLAISSSKNAFNNNIGSIFIVGQDGVLKKTIDVDSIAPKPLGIAHLNGDDKFMVVDHDSQVSIVDFDGIVLNQYDAATWAFGAPEGAAIHPSTCDHVVIGSKIKQIGGFNKRANAGGGNPNLLMVVANKNNLSEQEQNKKSLLEYWGYVTTTIDDQASAADYSAAVAVNDVAFVDENISANALDEMLAGTSIGVIYEEVNLSDEFGLSTSVSWTSGISLDIVDDNHYITKPFATGPLDVLNITSNLAFGTGTPAPGLTTLGAGAGNPMLMALEAGAEMIDSQPVAGRRVQLPWGESNFQLDNLTTAGEALLRRSIEWGLQPPIRCDADFAANNLVSEFAWMPGTGDIHGIDYLPTNLVVNGVTIPAGGGWIMSDKNKDRLFVTDLAGNPLTDFAMSPINSQGVAVIDAGDWIHHIAVADIDDLTQRVFYLDLDGDIVWSFYAKNITTDAMGISFIGETTSGIYDNHLAISSDKHPSGAGTATVSIVDQSGNLVKAIDVEAHASKPQGVSHVNGSDKLLIGDKDGLVSVIDFDGNLLHQYPASSLGLTEINDLTINPVTCEHVIVERDFKKISSLDADTGGSGAGPQYKEMHVPWAAASTDSWESKNLGIFGVPADAVAEVAIVNADGGKELWGGVRAAGSTLERRLQLHEADGGGTDVIVLQVQADSAGRIEHYTSDPDKLSFILLGYWTEVAYVDNWQPFKAGDDGNWVKHELNSYGVDPESVAEILLVNNDGFFQRQAGLRTDGSSLPRIVNLHEAKDGGDEGATLFVVAGSDSGATIEVYAEDDLEIDFYLAGHWATPPGIYTSAYADLGTASAEKIWQEADLGSFGVPAYAVAQIAPVNGEDGAEALLGVRSKGSASLRWLELHQSNNGGDDLAAIHVNTDSAGSIQWYDEDPLRIHQFYLLGWWELP